MPRLTKIYTRTGDDGTTGLGTGDRVPKTDPRINAIGQIDEANAAIGMAIALDDGNIPDILRAIQHELFDIGADLSSPTSKEKQPQAGTRITDEQTARLETLIDQYNADLAPLKNFILPGGTPFAAALHLARTMTRRAERALVALAESEPDRIGPVPLAYLNRLSDLLFVLARYANNKGRSDILWNPNAHHQAKPDNTNPYKKKHTSRDKAP